MDVYYFGLFTVDSLVSKWLIDGYTRCKQQGKRQSKSGTQSKTGHLSPVFTTYDISGLVHMNKSCKIGVKDNGVEGTFTTHLYFSLTQGLNGVLSLYETSRGIDSLPLCIVFHYVFETTQFGDYEPLNKRKHRVDRVRLVMSNLPFYR